MSNETKKFAGLESLQTFLENCKQLFATKEEVANKADASHTHDAYETKEDVQLKYDELMDGKADANHAHSWNDLEDRPFYTIDVETVLLEETSIYIPKAYVAYISLGNEFSLEVGKTYKVIFDGVTYECLAFELTNSNIAIGNESKEPFFIQEWNRNNGDLRKYIYSSQQGNHTISIIGASEEIVTLSEKFVPDTIVRISQLDEKAGLKVEETKGAEIFNDYENNNASGNYSHAEGYRTQSSGNYSHAEGYNAIASGDSSHAEGYETRASGDYSHAEGIHTKASSSFQHVQGRYNIEDTSNTHAHIVGNGANETVRSNAHTLDWDGNAWYAGTIKVGGTSYDDASEVALKSDLDNIDLSVYETIENVKTKIDETKEYADSAASTAATKVKNDLLNGAGDAYDTLQELGILIDENHDAIDALEIVATGKSDKNHTHTMESIEGLQDAVNAAADSKFYVVTFDMGDDGEYHGDLTFAQIREKFEAGGNMVARIDGTDYIPLLSAATHQIIFSGIYQATSVSLTISSNDVCTLTSTSLARSNHNHTAATQTSSGFMSAKDKIKLDGIDTSKYETKEDAQTKYDEILANQLTVQMITWEADD